MGYIKKRYIGLLALGVLLLLGVTFLFQALTIYDAQVIVKAKGEPFGVAPFTDRIDFGDIPQGETIGKTLVVKNEGTVPNSISVFVIGNIGNLVKVNPDSLTLKPGESREIKFQLTMPASATPERKYTGKVFLLRIPQSLW